VADFPFCKIRSFSTWSLGAASGVRIVGVSLIGVDLRSPLRLSVANLAARSGRCSVVKCRRAMLWRITKGTRVFAGVVPYDGLDPGILASKVAVAASSTLPS
jgi:hypothetical protein